MIRFQLLGALDLRDEDGRELRAILAQPKRVALLAYLAAASPAGSHRRDTLLGMFWPEQDQEHARNALSQAVRFLRRALGEAAIVSRSAEELALDETTVWADVRAFRTALDGGRVDQALELYRGDLLPSFFVPDAPGFEEWLERERARLRSQAAAGARLLAERHEAGRNLTLAVASARRAVELSNGDERPLRRLVELLDRLGDRAGALRAYEEFASKLATELEVEPAPETVALIQRIRAAPPLPLSAIIESSSAPRTSEPPITRLAKAVAHRYTVERHLGEGAMAVVALAHDLRHHRRVAIKILRPEISSLMGPERFLREIDIAASLMHPHILPLHDSGEIEGLLYYVMPYVEGESLRNRLDREGQLPIDDTLHIAHQVAEALAYAHSRGVVHRDIKPENILLSGEHALVGDFGIAKAIAAAGGERLTETGLAIGTTAYMSPEQAAADPRLDGRSDIYALGCVVYEMLGGQPPFTAPSAQAMLARHTLDPVPPLRTLRKAVPLGVEQVLLKALEKNPADRFRTATQFAEALANPGTVRPARKIGLRAPARRVTTWVLPLAGVATVTARLLIPGLAQRVRSGDGFASMSSVAVLPFDNLTGDSTKAYLADGLTADLIDELVRVEGLRVPSSATVVRYRGRRPEPGQVARELGVSAMVTGNVREIAGRPRVALQLVNTADGFVRWTGVYDQSDPAAGVDIAGTLAESLRVRLRPQSRLLARSGGTRDAAAYRLYLKGRQLVTQVGRASLREGVQALEQAIALDSSFADAWAALPVAYVLLQQLGGLTPVEGQALRRRAVDRAIALDSLNGEAYAARALLRVEFEWDYAAAEPDYRRALELTPGSALNHMLYAQFLLLTARDDSAAVVMRRALALDPTSPWVIANYANVLSILGRREEALAQTERALQYDSTHWVTYHIRAGLLGGERAVRELERALAVFGDSVPFLLGPLGATLARVGRRGEAERILAKLEAFEPRHAMWIAAVRLGLGDRGGALDALELSARNRDNWLSMWLALGAFEALRGEPRYEAVLKRVGVTEFRNRRLARAGRST